MREGYKNTEVGVIPEDWEVKDFGEICYPSKSRMNPTTSDSYYKCVELEHLSQGSGFLLGYANSKDLKSQKSFFEEGDVLFGKLRPYLRKFYFADFNGVCTTEIWVLKTEKNTSNRFLFHLVQSDKIIDAANLSTGTKMPRAEWKTVAETKIPVPTKSEQTAIATALSDADALINSLSTLIAKKRNIKQGAMQQLLKPKEGWEVKKLGDCLEKIIGGGTPSRSKEEYWGSEIPWVTVKDFATFNPYFTQEYITRKGLENSASHLIPRNTLIEVGT
jgi:type I restriction enzyme S subunit